MRLINADALQYSDARDMLPTGQYITREEIDKAAEPVVRCKDCRWRGKPGCAVMIVDESDEPKDGDFCSWGERRKEPPKEPKNHEKNQQNH